MAIVARLVDRALHTVSVAPPYSVAVEVRALHAELPIVDLLVGTPLFRPNLLARGRHGHVDLPRLIEGGVRVVGFSIATRFPDLRGTLSSPHFRSLGLPSSRGTSNMVLAEALIGRMERWAAESVGRLRLLRTTDDLVWALAERGRVGCFLGIQGGHVLDGRLENLVRLRERGLRMLAPAHVMDNELVGSNTGRRGHGLTPFGREVVAELQRCGVAVDLAHMSVTGLRETLPLLDRPFFLSHTGFRDLAGGGPPWRHYRPANRNLSAEDARLVAAAGGVIGISCSTALLGGEGLAPLVGAFRYGAHLVGTGHIALGSDFDGALRVTFDVAGLPLLTRGLLDAGFEPGEIRAMLGGNALRVLGPALNR